MFVMNLTDTELVYSTNGNRIRLFPGTVTEIDDAIVTPEKIKGCYGSRVDIIGEDQIAKVRQELEAPIEEHAELLDSLFNGSEDVIQNELGEQEGASDEVDNTNAEWAAKVAEADAYFENIEQDDDSDKHLKLEISKRLVEEAFKEDRYYDNVSLMEEIEKVFPEEKAKLIEEGKKLEEHKAELAKEGKDGETPKENSENNGEVSTPSGEVTSTNKETVKASKNKTTKGSKKNNK